MPPSSSIIGAARDWEQTPEGRHLTEWSERGKPTLKDDGPPSAPESDQYHYGQNNHDSVPISSAQASGYGADSFSGARHGAGPSPCPTGAEREDDWRWGGSGRILGGLSVSGMDAKAMRNYGKGELL
ncbi:hypothetical protein JCM10207_008812 [Rhodosporidiobolus poonsookiae]